MPAWIETIFQQLMYSASVAFFVFAIRAELGHFYPDKEAVIETEEEALWS